MIGRINPSYQNSMQVQDIIYRTFIGGFGDAHLLFLAIGLIFSSRFGVFCRLDNNFFRAHLVLLIIKYSNSRARAPKKRWVLYKQGFSPTGVSRVIVYSRFCTVVRRQHGVADLAQKWRGIREPVSHWGSQLLERSRRDVSYISTYVLDALIFYSEHSEDSRRSNARICATRHLS